MPPDDADFDAEVPPVSMKMLRSPFLIDIGGRAVIDAGELTLSLKKQFDGSGDGRLTLFSLYCL